MYVIFQGESLLIPATVTGNKAAITQLVVQIKGSKRGEVPQESAPVLATLAVEEYDSPEVDNGYLFKLVDTSTLPVGIYYVNYEYVINGMTFKGIPKKITIKESVI